MNFSENNGEIGPNMAGMHIRPPLKVPGEVEIGSFTAGD
jgi:hypothetical protein